MIDFLPILLAKLAYVMICAPFLSSALDKVRDLTAAETEVSALGLPVPRLTAKAVIALQVVAPAMIITGSWAWTAALLLAGFTTVATLLAHRWWTLPTVKKDDGQQVFMEHAALVGGLLLVAAVDLAGLATGSRG